MSDATTTAAATTDTTLIGGDGAVTTTAAAATTAATTEGTTTTAATTTAEPTAEEKAAADQAAADKAAADAAKAGAPEKYEDFTLPEGMTASPVLTEFATLAKELNLPQEAAQKVVDLAGRMQAENVTAVQAQIDAQAEKWGEDSKADKEFGGEAFDENLAIAKTALDKFGTPELKSLLNQSKLGNHPEVLRFFVRAGKAISQDGFIPGRQGGVSAKSFFDKSPELH